MTLFNQTQTEFMYKLYDIIEDMDDETKQEIINGLEEDLKNFTEEELLVLKQEQDRLIEERRKREIFEEHFINTERIFNKGNKNSFIPGFEVDDVRIPIQQEIN